MTATSIRTRNSATTTTSRSTTPATPRTTKATRKPKPKGTFPLFQHRNGQWAKKVNGKLYYFGTDKDAALERWKAEMDHIMAGRPVPRSDGTPQLAELGNVFHADCMQRVASGTLAKRSADEYERTIARMVDVFGRDSRPQHWTPMDFARLAEAFAQPVDRKTAIRGGIKGPSVTRRSAVTVAGDIRRAKAFLNWCADSELIPPPRYGRNFQPLSQREQRIIRSKTGRRDLAADDLRKILEHCSVWYKPIVMLGINGAIGNLDIAEMRLEQYDGEWLDLPRGKTGTPRRIWLWPETRKAIDAYLAIRRNRGDRLFYTRLGDHWHRDSDDAIGAAFAKARKAASVGRGTFYDLRRTFATVAGATKDIAAIKLVMGHTSQGNDMTALYTQAVDDARIRTVCAHVRDWLFT